MAITEFHKRGEMPTFTREEHEAAREQLKKNVRDRQLPEPSKEYVKRYGQDALLASILDNPNRILGTARLAPVASAKSEAA